MSLHSEIINIERHAQRRSEMQSKLHDLGVPFEIHPGVDIRNVGDEEIFSRCLKVGPWGECLPRNMACTLSHVAAWERFLETGKSHCLVLEDDVFLTEDFGEIVNDLSWWPQDAEVVKLEAWRGRSS